MIKITNQNLEQARIGIGFVQKNVPKAFVSALNRVATGLRTEAVRKVRETYVVKAGDVRQTIKITKANMSRMELILVSRGRSLPLIRFRTNPSRPPIRPPRMLRAQVKKSGSKKSIPGAFVARMQSGHVGVFERHGSRRLPIRQLYGPAVPVMLNESRVQRHLQEEAQRRMIQRLDHEINRVMGRLASK